MGVCQELIKGLGSFQIDTCHLGMKRGRLTNSGTAIMQMSTEIPPKLNLWSISAVKPRTDVREPKSPLSNQLSNWTLHRQNN